jgi:signal transduction histidine kinase/DNA-binding response OmpR family regulator
MDYGYPEILVVDDDSAVRQVLENVLTSRGYCVDMAGDSADAAQLISCKAYDAVFLDIVMPGESGLDFLQKLKSLQPDTPAIMITGMPNVETAAKALRLGAYDYIAKPVDHSALLNAAHRAVETKRLKDEKRRLETENLDYQRGLESLVEERTQKHRLQKEFLETILESLSHPFYVVDAEDYTISIANSAANFGPITEASTCYALTHRAEAPCKLQEQPCVLEKVKATGRPCMAEHFHFDQEGNPRIFEVHGNPIFDESGRLVRVIFYSLDISEQRRLESIASAKNLMENIGYVFSGIRHEIGNPINSLKTGLAVLQKQIENLPKEEIREFVRDALSEISRVEYLLRALKNFSLFEHPEIEDVDLAEFIKGLEPLLGEDLSKKGIVMQVHLPSEPCQGLVDVRALHHVMLNLLANAVDALEGEADPQIELSLKRQTGEIKIAFSDNGCGMTEKEKADLFKPFYTTKFNGTGLGLVMVKRMLSEMNCSIQITSYKGIGTTVTISIPEECSESHRSKEAALNR